MHYSLHLDKQFTVVFMTVSHSAQMLLKLEKCIPISHVTLESEVKLVLFSIFVTHSAINDNNSKTTFPQKI